MKLYSEQDNFVRSFIDDIDQVCFINNPHKKVKQYMDIKK